MFSRYDLESIPKWFVVCYMEENMKDKKTYECPKLLIFNLNQEDIIMSSGGKDYDIGKDDIFDTNWWGLEE